MVNQFVSGNMYRIVSSCCLLVYSFMFYVFGSFFRQFFRCQERKIPSDGNAVFHEQNGHQIDSTCSRDAETDKDDSVVVKEIASSVSTRRYEFLSSEGINGYLEEPKTLSFTGHEVFEDAVSDEMMDDAPILDPGGYAQEYELEAEDSVQEEREETVEIVTTSEFKQKNHDKNTLTEDKISDEDEKFGKTEEETEETEETEEAEDLDEQEHEKFTKQKISPSQVHFASRCPILPCDDAEVESTICSDGFCASNELSADRLNSESSTAQCPVFINEEEATVAESDDEYIELEPQNRSSIMIKPDQHEQEDIFHEEPDRKTCFPGNSEEPKSPPDNKCFSNSHDSDLMFEHEDIIEQLKMELKLARTGGLPTILEESEPETLETPKIVPELKPLKIDDKLGHKDVVDEIQKVYRSYLDKMRKLDILNFQTMHAVGLLQLKDTVGLHLSRRSSRSGKKVLLPQSLWFCKQGIAVVEPTMKSAVDMREDFEVVYVGQLCLSWEILHWQYGKLHELQSYDHQEYRRYNQVAGEFQLFQVLLHRFIENEPFQGPRVQNYTKNRCVFRNLLQVPAVKDDSSKNKGKRDDEDAITSRMLSESVEESMQVFWEFLLADKVESNSILQRHPHQNPIPRDALDAQLLLDVRTNLHKKEKKLKDILRSGNCIVKRLQKHQDKDQLPHSPLVAQVELKLVSRVLNMQKLTTEQLVWCLEKLDRISISKRHVFVETSFLVFPC